MIHHWKAPDLQNINSEYHHESACCWVSGAANNISERRCDRRERAREWAKRTSERGYCGLISVAQAMARVTGIIRNILYYLCTLFLKSSGIWYSSFHYAKVVNLKSRLEFLAFNWENHDTHPWKLIYLSQFFGIKVSFFESIHWTSSFWTS